MTAIVTILFKLLRWNTYQKDGTKYVFFSRFMAVVCYYGDMKFYQRKWNGSMGYVILAYLIDLTSVSQKLHCKLLDYFNKTYRVL